MRCAMTYCPIGPIRVLRQQAVAKPEDQEMTWTTLHHKAQQLGFQLECHGSPVEASSPPQRDPSWICVGSYGHMTGLWAQPVTAQARALAPDRVAAMISGCCQHVGTLPDYDEDFQACLAPLLAAVAHPEHGRSPA
jgi:hypothetical protein